MILGFWKDKNVEIHMKETNEIISGSNEPSLNHIDCGDEYC